MGNRKMSLGRFDCELPSPQTVVIENIVEDVLTTYIEEMDSLLSRLEVAAMSLESDKDSDDAFGEVRRILHSIKGDSGMCGVTDVMNVCHELESELDELQRNGSLADILLKVKDWMEGVIRHLSTTDVKEERRKGMQQNKSKPKLKALVIDDDIVCRERLKMLLQDFFDCTFACNGREGVLMYKKSLQDGAAYQLITLDINMPEMNGHEALRVIREIEEQHGIQGLDVAKVIMTTSESGSNHVFTAFREGCEAYVVKADMGGKLLDAVVQLGLLKVVKVQKDYVID